MSIRELIIKAHEKNLLRYPPENLMERLEKDVLVQLDLRRTFGSGVEFGYHAGEDRIKDAFQTIDGTQISTNDFIVELAQAVGEDPLDYIINMEEQPCQHYAPKKKPINATDATARLNRLEEAIARKLCVDEHEVEADVSDNGEEHWVLPVYATWDGRYALCDLESGASFEDQVLFMVDQLLEGAKEHRWLVTEITEVKARTQDEAIENAVHCIGSNEVISQDAELLEETEEWPVHVVVLQFARRPDTDDPINWDWSDLEDTLNPLVRDVEWVTGGVIGTREYNV